MTASRGPFRALILLALVGLANTIVDVSAYTLLQRAVPDAVLARVFGLLESIIYATVALGGLIASALTEAFGLRVALVCTGVFLPVLVAALWRHLPAIDAETPASERELELLRGVPFLASLPPLTLERLATRLIPLTIRPGEPVFSQGDPGDRFYLIAEGEADVSVGGQGRPPLQGGDSFGEIALLRDIPRTATITARGELVLYALERDDFLAALSGHGTSHQAAWAVVEARLGRAGTTAR